MREEKSNPLAVAAACGADVSAEVDRVCGEFLAANGYPEALDKNMSSTLRDAIRKKMSKRGERLHIKGWWDDKCGQYVIWFTMQRGKRVLATSRAVRLQGKAVEGYNDAQG